MRSTFGVVYDVCVVHSAVLRDFLLRLAVTGMFQAKWSDRIVGEAVESVVARRAEVSESITPGQAEHLAGMMRRGVPDSVVEGSSSSRRESTCQTTTTATWWRWRSAPERR